MKMWKVKLEKRGKAASISRAKLDFGSDVLGEKLQCIWTLRPAQENNKCVWLSQKNVKQMPADFPLFGPVSFTA